MFDKCWNTNEKGGFFQPSSTCLAILFVAATALFLVAFAYIRKKDENHQYKNERGHYRKTFMKDLQDDYMSLIPLYILCLLATFPIIQFISMRMNNDGHKDTTDPGLSDRTGTRFLETSW